MKRENTANMWTLADRAGVLEKEIQIVDSGLGIC